MAERAAVPLGWSCPAACSWCRILPASSNGQWIQSPQILPDLGQRSPAVARKTMEGKGREQRNEKKHFNKGIYSVTQSRGGQHRRELGQKHKPQTQRWGADPLELGVGGCLPHPQPGERSAGHQPHAREEKSSGAGQDSVNQPAAVA